MSKPAKTQPPKYDARVTPTLKLARNEPSQEQIARRAYEIFLARGGEHGQHVDDWLQAERELRLGS
jgi:hypothetical protein